MTNPKITIQIVVLNGEKYIRHCLESVLAQSYPSELTEINILDNGSTDGTIDIIKNYKITFTKSDFNYGMWGGHEKLLEQAHTPYVVFLSADVIMDKDFILNAVTVMDKDSNIGALQAKVYQFNVEELRITNYELRKKIIDSCGFKIFRSRRVINIGHGEVDKGQFNKQVDIFGVEGAVPIFRVAALQSIRVLNEIADHDLFWYAEDLDVAWRIRMTGWKQCYEPSVIAWHDRQTTKKTRHGLRDFIIIRRAIPLHKRRLEWRNIRCTITKNDYIINILKDLPYLLFREVAMTIYLLVFETAVLTELPTLLKLMPRMLRKRKEIMKRAKISPVEIHSYFS